MRACSESTKGYAHAVITPRRAANIRQTQLRSKVRLSRYHVSRGSLERDPPDNTALETKLPSVCAGFRFHERSNRFDRAPRGVQLGITESKRSPVAISVPGASNSIQADRPRHQDSRTSLFQ
jgi:hypothetical protein